MVWQPSMHMGIDNCLIQVNGPEYPILDGSAQYNVNEIERVCTVEQNAVEDIYIHQVPKLNTCERNNLALPSYVLPGRELSA
jgi:UDP-3-O-acyl-N-acetylglucosamine deacetylase